MSMDSRERMSSMGARITKKDTRPINDKNFIQDMTAKVSFIYFPLFDHDYLLDTELFAMLPPACKRYEF